MRTGAHRCAQVCTHTHYSDMNSTGKQLGNMFSTTLLLACKFLTTFIIFGYCAHRCAQVRTDMNSTGKHKHVFHHFATCLQVFDNFHNFWILCAQVRTGAHRCYSDMNSTGKQLGNMFSTTLLLACKFLTTFIIFGYCAHRCAQVRTGAHKCTHTIQTWIQLGNNLETCFPPLCYLPASFWQLS